MTFDAKDIAAWLFLLDGMSDAEGRRAAYEVCRKLKFTPKAADLWEIVHEMREARRVPPLALPPPEERTDPAGVEEARMIIRRVLGRIGVM